MSDFFLSPYRNRIELILLMLFAASVASAEDAKPERPAFALKIEEPVSFTVVQRGSKAIPGSSENLVLRIGDITGKMVLVSIRDKQSNVVLRETPICLDEEVPFEIGERKYALTLSELDNKLIGEDSATFSVGPVDDDQPGARKDPRQPSVKFGNAVPTKVSGTLLFERRNPPDWIEMRLGARHFALQPGNWCWLSRDEILKIISATETEVVYRLYQPAPSPRPF